MTALRQQMHELIDSVPEEVLQELIYFMRDEKFRQIEKEKRLEKKRIAFEKFKSLCKPIPDLDEDKEKEEYFKEKYGL